MKCLHQIISFRLVADLKFSTLCAGYCALGIRKKWFQCCKTQMWRKMCNYTGYHVTFSLTKYLLELLLVIRILRLIFRILSSKSTSSTSASTSYNDVSWDLDVIINKYKRRKCTVACRKRGRKKAAVRSFFFCKLDF